MANESFGIGDVVEIVDTRKLCRCRHLIGTEATIKAGPFISFQFESGIYYQIDGVGGLYNADPLCLRKKPQPKNDETLDTVTPLKLVRWSECPWRPSKVRL